MYIITTREAENSTEISFRGDLNIHNRNDLVFKFVECSKKKPAKIAINCEQMASIDSSGLGALIKLSQLAQKENIELHLCQPSSNVCSVFDICNLGKIFNITTIKEFRET